MGAAIEAREVLDLLPPDLVAEAELVEEGYAPKDVDALCGITRQGRHDRRRRIVRRLGLTV